MQDPTWIREQLDAHEAALLRYAQRLLGGDLEAARDVVQDTFLRLCKQPRRRVADHPREWLFTVCRNRALDLKARRDRLRRAPLEALDGRAGEERGPADAVEAGEAQRSLLERLEGLPATQQEVVRLRFQGGLSYREISRVTQLSESNVGYLLHTALKALKAQLNPVTS
jgi:RNA polymerase sigma-70 factor (ECF subfamily)